MEQDWRLLNVFFFYNKLFYSLTLSMHILESKLSESFYLFSKFLCYWLTVMYYLRFKVYLRCKAKSVFNAIINIGVKVNFSVICFRWLLVDHLTRLLTNIVELMCSSWSFSLHNYLKDLDINLLYCVILSSTEQSRGLRNSAVPTNRKTAKNF